MKRFSVFTTCLLSSVSSVSEFGEIDEDCDDEHEETLELEYVFVDKDLWECWQSDSHDPENRNSTLATEWRQKIFISYLPEQDIVEESEVESSDLVQTEEVWLL